MNQDRVSSRKRAAESRSSRGTAARHDNVPNPVGLLKIPGLLHAHALTLAKLSENPVTPLSGGRALRRESCRLLERLRQGADARQSLLPGRPWMSGAGAGQPCVIRVSPTDKLQKG